MAIWAAYPAHRSGYRRTPGFSMLRFSPGPGNDEIQLDLFGDYQSNVALYPKFQEYLRTQRPPLLAVWGKNDPFFLPAERAEFQAGPSDAVSCSTRVISSRKPRSRDCGHHPRFPRPQTAEMSPVTVSFRSSTRKEP